MAKLHVSPTGQLGTWLALGEFPLHVAPTATMDRIQVTSSCSMEEYMCDWQLKQSDLPSK